MTYSDPLSVLQLWMAAINSGNSKAAGDLYAEKALLFPTFSSHALRTPEERFGYFDLLTKREQLQVTLHERTLHLNSLSEEHQVLCGIYRFSFVVDEQPLNFEARFSFLLDLEQQAPILHHHSSQVPRGLD